MSNKAIIIAVLLAVGLLGLIAYSNWRSNAPTGSGPGAAEAVALPINAAEVIGVKVRSGNIEEGVKRDASGAWVFVFPTAAPTAPAPAPAGTAGAPQPEPLTWPADPEPIQNFVRAVSELAPAPGGERGGKIPDNAALVSLKMTDGSTRLVRISPNPVAGKTLVDIDGKAAFMGDASVLTLATQPGPRGWRINRALPGASPNDLSRIGVRTSDESLAFSKQENRWFISRPVSARASGAGVGTMLDALGRITIERFVSEGGPVDGAKVDLVAAGLASPRMIITTERDIRTLDATGTIRTDTKRRDLFVGGPADGSGSRLYASSDASGVPMFIIDASSVAAISTAARNYIDITASSASPSDVGLITLRAGTKETGYRRVNGKWHRLLPGGKTEKSESDSKAIAEMVEFLTTRQGQPDLVAAGAAGANAKQPTEAVSNLKRVSLMTDDGTEIDTLTMGYTPDGTLAARSRDVVLTYTGAAPPKLLSMPEFKPAPGQPVKRKAKPPVGPSKK